MKQLFELFNEIGLPYYRQGSMSDADYEPDFFTFWNIDTPNLQIRDNKAKSYVEYVQVGYYTNNAENIYTVMDSFIEKAKAKGFVVVGRAKDADADRADYFGRVCYIRIINNLEG